MYELEFILWYLITSLKFIFVLFRLRVAEPLEEKLLFLKGYFNLDYKHTSHHMEACKASVSRSGEVSLSLSEVYFPQLIYAW